MSSDSDERRLAELRRELEKAEKAPLVADIDRVGWIFQAYEVNASVLLRHITAPHAELGVAAETRIPGNNPDIYRRYYAEMIRLMLNYTASAASLRDHMRVVEQKMQVHNPDDYEHLIERRLQVSGTSIAQFIIDLRNFIIHRGLPTVGGQFSHSQGDDGFRFDTLLDPNQLRSWNGWKSASQAFLREHEEISLSKTITDYDALLRPFYDWVFKELETVCFTNAKRVSDLLVGINNIEARLARR